MTGYSSQIDYFEICCAAILLSDILQSIIWPELNVWKSYFESQQSQINNLAAAGMISLLLYLRKIILQNLVTLHQHFPGYLVWNHPVFQHEAYAAFSQRIEACQNAEMTSSKLSIFYQAMPQLADCLKSLDMQNKQRIQKLKLSINHVI